jgi:hypothetical protein
VQDREKRPSGALLTSLRDRLPFAGCDEGLLATETGSRFLRVLERSKLPQEGECCWTTSFGVRPDKELCGLDFD